MTTGLLSATSYTDETRSGGLVWTNVGNASLGPPFASNGPYTIGSISDWLRGSAFTPSSPVPTGATITDCVLHLRHRLTGEVYPILFTTIEIYVSGALKQTIATNASVPYTFTEFPYTLSVAAMGLTPALLNAGAVDVRIAYATRVDIPPVPNVPDGVDVEYLALEAIYTASGVVSGNIVPPPLIHLPTQGLTVL